MSEGSFHCTFLEGDAAASNSKDITKEGRKGGDARQNSKQNYEMDWGLKRFIATTQLEKSWNHNS